MGFGNRYTCAQFRNKNCNNEKKGRNDNAIVSDDVAYFIASRAVSNIRELEGALIRVFAFASLTKQEITIDLAKKGT